MQLTNFTEEAGDRVLARHIRPLAVVVGGVELHTVLAIGHIVRLTCCPLGVQVAEKAGAVNPLVNCLQMRTNATNKAR